MIGFYFKIKWKKINLPLQKKFLNENVTWHVFTMEKLRISIGFIRNAQFETTDQYLNVCRNS